MVALGNKANYVKDAIIQTAAVVWVIYSSSNILVKIGRIADMIDKPIKCGVSQSTTGDLSSRQLMILEHCEVIDGEFYIPQDAWTGERTWFDVLLVFVWCYFALFTLLFVIGSIFQYCGLIAAEDELKRHAEQTRLDQVRSSYILSVTGLTFNFLFLFAVVLNKLTAFGAWDGISATEVLDSTLDAATVVAHDQESWDMEESFLPDFSDLFSFQEPDSDHEQYVGAYVHSFAIYCGMSLLKNVFIALIGLVTDDWHIVSLIIASIPVIVVIALLYMPYMASFYLFKLVGLHFYLQFDFEFNHELRTCVFGGIMFGTGFLLMVCSFWIISSMSAAALLYDRYIDRLKEEETEPDCMDISYIKLLAINVSKLAPAALPLLSVFGIIGISCLGYVKDVVGTDNAAATFNFILALWVVNWCMALAFSLAVCCCMGENPSLGHDVTFEDVLPTPPGVDQQG